MTNPLTDTDLDAIRGELEAYDRYDGSALPDDEAWRLLRAVLAEVDRLRARVGEVEADTDRRRERWTADAALMGEHCANAERERDEARAALAEALATLANERGEGEPPSEGWEWSCSGWGEWEWVGQFATVKLETNSDDEPAWVIYEGGAADLDRTFKTARAAMRAADDAVRSKG